ncbi:MAG: class I SAM-dependent methyltransferase [Pseudomonadota bacterium]
MGKLDLRHQALFTKYYAENTWQGEESRSGPSSGKARTENLRRALARILTDLNVSVFLDAPCGDFFWMSHIIDDIEATYIGADIVEPAIDQNAKNFGRADVSFVHLDIVNQPLPSADMVFSRDFLFHLSYSDIARFLSRLFESDARYVMTTTHDPQRVTKNSDIETGGWRWMDLLRAPFHFPFSPLFEVVDGGGDRKMCVWEIDEVQASTRSFISQYTPKL